jgi:hypothetical protein
MKTKETLKEVDEIISKKIRFQMDIISDDFANGVQTSMKVFYKVLEDLLFYAEKEEALKQEQDKNKYSEEEVLVKLYECLGHFAYHHNIVINGNEINEWFEQFKNK